MEAPSHQCYYKFNYDFILRALDFLGRLYFLSGTFAACVILVESGDHSFLLESFQSSSYLQEKHNSTLTWQLADWSGMIFFFFPVHLLGKVWYRNRNSPLKGVLTIFFDVGNCHNLKVMLRKYQSMMKWKAWYVRNFFCICHICQNTHDLKISLLQVS